MNPRFAGKKSLSWQNLRKKIHIPSSAQDISKNESDFAQNPLLTQQLQQLHLRIISFDLLMKPPRLDLAAGNVAPAEFYWDSELQAATVAPACSKLLKVLKNQSHW